MRKILIADSNYFDEYFMLGQMQYAFQFAKHGWDVAYITNPLSPFNTIFGRDKRIIFSRLLKYIKGGVNVTENIWYYIPFSAIPFHNHKLLAKEWLFNNYYKFTVPSIRAISNKKGFSSVDLLWLGTSHQKFWKDILDYKCCILRISDNSRAYGNVSDILLKAGGEIIQSSDFILVTSKVLLEKYKYKYNNKKFIYLPNGVDLSHFIRNQYNKPKEYSDIDSRIALYVGAIDRWFDSELLLNVAKQCREITFFIIGVDSSGIFQNISQPNIHYLGPRDYQDIPNYIYYSDCGIIPFNNSKLVQSVSPIKMYEFFSLGKPVVSRAWEELKLLDSPCFLAKNAKEFVDILKDKNTFSIDSSKLVNYARDNTWHKRYLEVIKLLKSYGI